MKNFIRAECAKRDSVTSESSRFVSRLIELNLVGLLLFFIFLSPVLGQSGNSQDVRYTLSPVGSGTAWNNHLGLKDGFLYGGKLGIDFGPLIGLEASYLTSADLWTRFSEIGLLDTAGMLVRDQRVKVKRYGGDLLIRWPSGRIAPFVKIGGGVIRFEPDAGENTEKVDVRLGGGLDYMFAGRLRTRAWVEMNRFRLDRYSLAPGDATNDQYPLDPEADKIRNNLSVGLSLDYALGQSRFRAEKGRERLQPFSVLELEPLIGRLDSEDPRMTTLTVAGARIGGELNPWVGWGLFYWHGIESDFSDTRPLQSYGGEARFRLASKTGPQPYITIGAGQLDFRSGFVDDEGRGYDDKTALILGAGIRAEIVQSVLLNVGVRDYMYGQGRLNRVSGITEISHNWLFSGALVFGIGGRGSAAKQRPVPPGPSPERAQVAPQKSDTEPPLPQQHGVDDTSAVAPQPAAKAAATSYVSGKNIVIPVPLEGEIYIRYGRTLGDAKKRMIEGVTKYESIQLDTLSAGDVPERTAAVDTSTVGITEPPADLPVVTSPPSTPSETAPLSRRELDSLLGALRSDISTMLASSAVPQATQKSAVDSTGFAVPEDSLIAALKEELANTQQERKRLDSLLRAQALAAEAERDSLTEQRLQQAIADQVAVALAAESEQTGDRTTQSDLDAMMSALTSRMDLVTTERAAIDSVRLRDQLQLEIIRQTKSQEDFQRATEDFIRRYGQQQENRSLVPPAIIVTQPAPSPQVIDRESPTTVVIKPDTQYVVIRDSTSRIPDSLGEPGFDAATLTEEKDFIDLRPTGYTGFGLERPKQFILGGRLDIGPITSKEERLRLVPEFALGLGGGGVSVMAVINAEYHIVDIESGNYRLIPYVRMGFGVLGFGGDISERDTEGVLNLTYGFSVDPRKAALLRDIGSPAIFLEHQIIDLFDLNRVVLGLQWSP
jgi:hypothetical protein